MSRYNKNTVPAYDDDKYLGNLTRKEIIEYQEEKKENKNLRTSPRTKFKASGGRIEKAKGGTIRKTTKGPSANYRKTKSGAGMTAKGVRAYRAANPGSKLKTAVTGKVKKGSAAAKRRKSYCARSAGQLKNSSAKTRNDPNSRIRQARRRWKC